MRFFFFGSLRDHDILEAVIGRAFPRRAFPAAQLPDHRLERMAQETFPLLVAAAGALAPGVVVEGLEAADIERIHFFESVEYEASLHSIALAGGGALDCHLFAATKAKEATPASLGISTSGRRVTRPRSCAMPGSGWPSTAGSRPRRPTDFGTKPWPPAAQSKT